MVLQRCKPPGLATGEQVRQLLDYLLEEADVSEKESFRYPESDVTGFDESNDAAKVHTTAKQESGAEIECADAFFGSRRCTLPCDNATRELQDGEGSSMLLRSPFPTPRVVENVCSMVNEGAELKSLNEMDEGGEGDQTAKLKVTEEVDESERESLRYPQNKVAVVGVADDAGTVKPIAIQETGTEIEGADALFGSRCRLLPWDNGTCELQGGDGSSSLARGPFPTTRGMQKVRIGEKEEAELKSVNEKPMEVGVVRAMGLVSGFYYDPTEDSLTVVDARLRTWPVRRLPLLTVADVCCLARASRKQALQVEDLAEVEGRDTPEDL